VQLQYTIQHRTVIIISPLIPRRGYCSAGKMADCSISWELWNVEGNNKNNYIMTTTIAVVTNVISCTEFTVLYSDDPKWLITLIQ